MSPDLEGFTVEFDCLLLGVALPELTGTSGSRYTRS